MRRYFLEALYTPLHSIPHVGYLIIKSCQWACASHAAIKTCVHAWLLGHVCHMNGRSLNAISHVSVTREMCHGSWPAMASMKHSGTGSQAVLTTLIRQSRLQTGGWKHKHWTHFVCEKCGVHRLHPSHLCQTADVGLRHQVAMSVSWVITHSMKSMQDRLCWISTMDPKQDGHAGQLIGLCLVPAGKGSLLNVMDIVHHNCVHRSSIKCRHCYGTHLMPSAS